MEIKEGTRIVSQIFKEFSAREGSQHIATRSSMFNVLRLLDAHKPSSILDWGAGIGTITSLCLTVTNSKIDVFERDEWCREKFRTNVPSFTGRVFLELECPKYDFVIVDDDITRRQIHSILRFKGLKVVFIEGWRNRTVGHFSKRLLVHGFAGTFTRSESQLHLFGEGDKWEKSGSWFILEHKGIHPDVFISWIRRWRSTREGREVIKEFYFWLGRSIRPHSRLSKIRSLFGGNLG